MPAEGPRPTRLLALLACALALTGAAAGQEPAPPPAPEAAKPPALDAAAPPLPEAAAPWSRIAPDAPETAVDSTPPSLETGAAAQELPLPDAGLGEAAPAELPTAEPLDTSRNATTDPTAGDDAGIAVDDDAPADAAPPPGVGNDDVLAMTRAQFSEPTILAVIQANPTRFDVSPRALVALKTEGVSETVIAAMLSAEQAKRTPPVEDDDDDAEPSEEFLKLSAMIERLAAQQEAAEAARRPPDPPKSADSSPRAWTLLATDKTAIAPTIAQVAFTDEKGGNRLKTLQSLAGKALAFTNPAVSGIATTLGGLFRSDEEERTAVWALAGSASSRELSPQTGFEIGFAHTPGVDPDAYLPAIVRLVRTNDNYRLVAAAKTEGTKTIATTKDPIVEELVPVDLTRIARGHYRVQPKERLAAGEYALVLRPIVQKERRRRGSDASLGELLGGGTSQVLYLTWDFSVAASD